MPTATSTTPITATGVKGFLQWYKREQPAIYAKAAPQIAKLVPQALSDYLGGGWKTAGLGHSARLRKTAADIVNGPPMSGQKMSGLGDDTQYFSDAISPSQIDSSGFDYGSSESLPSANLPDISTVANAGSSSTPTTSQIGTIITGIASLGMTAAQISAQNQILQTNLQRAAAGLPPLNTSMSSLGVPQISASGLLGSSGGSGTLLLLLGLGVAAVALTSRK